MPLAHALVFSSKPSPNTETRPGQARLPRIPYTETPFDRLIAFNRSLYEDVVAVRVHDLVPKETWQKRYDQINNFEEILADANTIVVKSFLHISPDEHERRLLDRENDSRKFWKLNPSDWIERDFWDETTEAYEDVFNKCSSKERPWHIIPSDKKWFRDVAVLETLVSIIAERSRTRAQQKKKRPTTPKAKKAVKAKKSK